MQNIIKQKKLQNTIKEYKVKLIKDTLGTTKEKSYFSHSIEQLER